MLLEASGTIVLTERIHVDNVMMFGQREDIRNASNIWPGSRSGVCAALFLSTGRQSHHGGRFNYLMVDSHVELLLPSKTTSDLGLRRGMWSIKAGD